MIRRITACPAAAWVTWAAWAACTDRLFLTIQPRPGFGRVFFSQSGMRDPGSRIPDCWGIKQPHAPFPVLSTGQPIREDHSAHSRECKLNIHKITKSLQLRPLVPFSILLASILVVGCGGGETAGHSGNGNGPGAESEQEEPAIAVKISPVALESISSLYSTSATLRADRQATVIARTRGVVERLVVEEGDKVASGQALAYLEDDEQKIAAARALSNEEKAQRDFARISGLHDRGLSSLDEFEASRTTA
ncbi:MAG: biotin/lipoyl-binding protein, partial [Candidatus Aminicenantes bacterium]